MAIYRSDQAVVTFGAEAALGGYPEAATVAVQTADNALLSADLPAGSLVATVDNLSGLAVGNMVRIGSPNNTASGQTALVESEVRRIVAITDSNTKIHLNAPTAHFHADDERMTEITSITDDATDHDKFVTYIPGVYDTVTTPDFTPTIEPRYYLGTGSKRNFSTAYKGTQSYNGSWPSFILLNGWPLRFPIGTLNSTSATRGGTLTLGANAKAGDLFITASGTTGITANVYLNIGTSGTSKQEIVRCVSTQSAATSVKLTTPLKYDHSSGEELKIASGVATHVIEESNVLPSISMGVHMLDSSETAANAFDRKFFGGKVGAATISAEEGGLLVMGWDTIPFMGMSHNQKDDDNFTGNVPFYQLAHAMDRTMVGSKTGAAGALSYPESDPYYFSEGTVSLFGTEFARLRNFTININNNVEPRYYIERRGDSRNRGPSDIVEMRREYTMEATIALPDSQAATSTTTTLFKELLLEGDYGSGMRGFNIKLLFERGTDDTITIQIPDDGDLTQADQSPSGSTGAATGLDEQGAYLLETPHPIDGSNPYEVSASLMFRNLKMTIVDSQMLYP